MIYGSIQQGEGKCSGPWEEKKNGDTAPLTDPLVTKRGEMASVEIQREGKETEEGPGRPEN